MPVFAFLVKTHLPTSEGWKAELGIYTKYTEYRLATDSAGTAERVYTTLHEWPPQPEPLATLAFCCLDLNRFGLLLEKDR